MESVTDAITLTYFEIESMYKRVYEKQNNDN